MTVSILMPCYNSARFIEKSIESVRAQTYPDWELLITDDGSRDNTIEVVEKFCRLDSRIQLFKQPQNKGPAEARNRSLENAKGEYLALLDSDDLWPPHKLSTQISWMIANHSEFSFTAYRRMTEDETKVGDLVQVPNELNYHSLLKNTAITTSTVVLKKTLADGIRFESGWGYDDFLFWLNILKKGGRAQGIPQDLATYRVVSGSVSGRHLRSARWVWNIYRKHERLSLPKSLWSFAGYGLRAVLKRLTLHLA